MCKNQSHCFLHLGFSQTEFLSRHNHHKGDNLPWPCMNDISCIQALYILFSRFRAGGFLICLDFITTGVICQCLFGHQKVYNGNMNFGNKEQEIPQNQLHPKAEENSAEARGEIEASIRPRIHEFFKDHGNILDSALLKINTIPYATDEEFEDNLVKELSVAFLAFITISGFSEKEARVYYRRFMEEKKGYIPLDSDSVLTYSRFEDTIDLHITDGFTLELFQEDMSNLAKIIQSDGDIKTIVMSSWIVAKYPKSIKRSGFTIDEPLSETALAEIRSNLPPEMRNKPWAQAHMTREDFLARWPGIPEDKE